MVLELLENIKIIYFFQALIQSNNYIIISLTITPEIYYFITAYKKEGQKNRKNCDPTFIQSMA